ncbi:unnamed protein product (mitochondrion) [Plasmodiophora brassicae]|uniref:ubiquitinyl hydrolase 1 n=1 Tax=Plasmodiophora brassicae TaxID=37360 RepID=A0A0G4ISR2_PLABS|nr:hypothetical protein PBRA_006419 [Plasmodiophora brassicae]SPQ95121.1 unnamed protein product [Plasmodiophora brassicae]
MPVHHERQAKSLCAVHAINSLLQGRVVTQATLDAICLELNPSTVLNPHRSMLGRGDYDVNVVQVALERNRCSARWVNNGKPMAPIIEAGMATAQFVGILVNVRRWRVPLWESRHWFAIVVDNDTIYNCDSMLAQPTPFASRPALFAFLQDAVANNDGHLFIVERIPPPDHH